MLGVCSTYTRVALSIAHNDVALHNHRLEHTHLAAESTEAYCGVSPVALFWCTGYLGAIGMACRACLSAAQVVRACYMFTVLHVKMRQPACHNACLLAPEHVPTAQVNGG